MLSKELGAAHFNPQTNELTSLLDEYPELNQIGLITHAVPWDAHSILFASQYGLFVYDCRKKKVFYPEGDRPGALFKCRNMKFNSVFRDRRGWFWLGTHDGLNLYIPEKKKFYSYYQEDGLPNNIIQTVTEGTEKNIIYAATSTASRCSPSTPGRITRSATSRTSTRRTDSYAENTSNGAAA